MRLALAVAVASLAMVSSARLSVEVIDGEFRILRDGKPVVERMMVDLGGACEGLPVKRSFSAVSGIGRVWNVWCEDMDRRYRLEVVERADGAVELTLIGQMEGVSKYRNRRLYMYVPMELFDGYDYEALQGDGREWRETTGVFGGAFRRDSYRWLAVNGIVWDFNPLGAGNYCSQYNSGTICGICTVIRQGGKRHYELSSGSSVKGPAGGFTGTKIVLREGVCADYDKYHHLRSFRYNQACFAKRAVAFGAPKHGKNYVDGDRAFDAELGFGWVGDVCRKTKIGHDSGAYYSHVIGRGVANYRFAGLSDGFYIFTLQAGNWTGEKNRFAVAVNETEIAVDVAVEKGKARTLSRVVRVTGGTADVKLSGDWLVSALAVQPLMADGEDFSVRRGLWATEGYEPGILHRSCDFARPMKFPVLDETVEMPVPGLEAMAQPRDPPAPVRVPDRGDPAFAWLHNAKTYSFGGNATALYFPKEGAGSVDAILGRETAGLDYNLLFVSGMHSRHTYIGHIGRGVKSMGEIAQVAHKRGMKLIDHHDATMFWNEMGGFRAMMARLPETIRSVHDNLPSFQMCPNNPVFKEKYFAYLRALIGAGVDGFQLDEVVFWAHGCACKACREKFHAETGWWLPLDETDATFANCRSKIARRWHAWKVRSIANWFVELKDAVKDIKPDLVLLMYTTHWGFIASYPQNGLTNDLLELGRVVNYFGTEVMTRNPLQSSRSLMPYRRMKNIFTSLYGSPVWGIYYGATPEGDYFSWSISNMLGQGALLHSSSDGNTVDYTKWGKSGLNMNLDGATQVAKIAVLFSAYSRDWNDKVPFIEEEFGLAQGLEAIHAPYEFVADQSLNASSLAKYEMLCLGASQCLSDAEVSAIAAFMARGGKVFSSVEAGRCNEFGESREKWPFANAGKNFIYRPDMHAAAFCAREAEVGREWRFNPDVRAEREYRDKLMEVTACASYWKVSAPATVFTTLWKESDGTLVAHFLNAGGACLKPGEKITATIPEVPFPPIEKDMTLTLPVKGISSAAIASPEFSGTKELGFVANPDGTTTVVVPAKSFTTYAVVKIR